MSEELRDDALAVIRAIRRLRLSITHGLGRRLSSSGITIAQFGAMELLMERGESTMSDLADKLGTTLGAVTNLVDKLVTTGYASRERSRADRRVVNVTLTPQGDDIVDRYHTWGSESLARFFGEVPSEARRTFVDLLGKLADYIEEDVKRAPGAPEEQP